LKLRKLNGWQWIGIILSVVWILGGGVRTYVNLVHLQTDWVGVVYHACEENAARLGNDHEQCDNEMLKNNDSAFDLVYQGWPWEFLLFVLVPLPLAWGAAYGLIGLVGWVRKGFNRQSTLGSDSAGEGQGTYPVEDIDPTDIGDIPTHAMHLNCQFLVIDQIPNEEEAVRW
jgi:hypothetical protein